MSESLEAHLRRLFETDKSDPQHFFKQNPFYVRDGELGAKPWWPPLSKVWFCGPDRMTAYDKPQCWADAWALLQKLHAQYLEQSGKGRKLGAA